MNIFDVNGSAALSDFRSSEWRNIFTVLEREQETFLRKQELFRSSSYQWPRDPLHSWSRAWEYPYIYFHLARWRRQWRDNEESPRVADVGSGVTFFPFTVANLGYQVICTDIDPVCESDMRRAIRVIQPAVGSVDFRLINSKLLPFHDHEIDAAYCISVLEHIPDFEQTISEIARIVRPEGLVLFTVDLDLSGKGELSPMRHKDLLTALELYFEPIADRRAIAPRDQLTSRSGPYPLTPRGAMQKTWFRLRQAVKPLFGMQPSRLGEFYLAVEGMALRRIPSAR